MGNVRGLGWVQNEDNSTDERTGFRLHSAFLG